jgi:hypothetical protein
LLLPGFEGTVDRIAAILEYGELPIILHLLIWGAKSPRGPMGAAEQTG